MTRPPLPGASSPSPDLVDEDPRAILARVITSGEARARQEQVDLAEARHALTRLQGPVRGTPAEVARVTLEVAPSLVNNLLATTTGPLRNVVMRTDAGAGTDPEMDAFTREVVGAGRNQRTIYDSALLARPEALAHAHQYRVVGEEQRVMDNAPTEFCVFGDEAVVCTEIWGDPDSDYVLIRDPMLVAAFTMAFDQAWETSFPFPTTRAAPDVEDEQLLDLLARGLKDEAIARYLGWSLRTVRRRVARLMDDLGARTRFQLGAEAVRAGRLASPGARTASSRHPAAVTAGVPPLGQRHPTR